MNNEDGQPMDNQGEYPDQYPDGANLDPMEGDDMGDQQPNEGGDEGEVDQYFDDNGDIGFLPADHVSNLVVVTVCVAADGQTAERPHEAVDGRARASRPATQREGKPLSQITPLCLRKRKCARSRSTERRLVCSSMACSTNSPRCRPPSNERTTTTT